MKIGFNLLLWTAYVRREHWSILEDLKRRGYDGVEVPIFEGSLEHYEELGQELKRIGLEATAASVIADPAMNPIGADQQQREAGLKYLERIIECAAAMNAKILCGPLHSVLGQFSGVGATQEERQRGIDFPRRAGDIAARHDVVLVLEAPNRFESYFVNTMDDLASYLDGVNHPNVAGMYDTFHSNIEEKDPVAAVGAIRRHLAHVHVSENDRGTPGRGHIDFAPVFQALKQADYDGWITIEAFGRALPELAAATRVWRDLSPTPEQVHWEGYDVIRNGWDAV